MRLRYTGLAPTTFMSLGVEVEPGAEITVTDDAAPLFLARADIETVTEAEEPVRSKPTKSPARASDPAGTVPAPVTTEEVDRAVSDDH